MPSDTLSTTLNALADPTRRALLSRLIRKNAPVGELAKPFDMSLAAVSKHLQVLERAGLVSRTRDAQWRVLELQPRPLREVDRWLDGYRHFWERSLDSLAVVLAEIHPPKKSKRRKS